MDPRIVHARAFAIDNEELAAKLEGMEFYSVTYRLFKHTNLEPSQEDYGQVALYKLGTVSDGSENAFALDLTHIFEAGRIVSVSGNTACMLQNTRLSQHFQVFEAEEERKDRPVVHMSKCNTSTNSRAITLVGALSQKHSGCVIHASQ